MRNKFFMACVAVIIFSIMLCTLIDCNTANESTDRLEKAIKEEEDSGDNTTIINNYNDNSTTINNNTTNNYYNTDTDNDEEDEEVAEEVYETEETIVDDKSDKEDYKEYNNNNNSDYNNTESNSSNNNDDTITPIGDLKNDMNPDPDVVHIKNIKCPSCGAYSYIEHYNLNDEDLLFYMGTCNSCGYERQ